MTLTLLIDGGMNVQGELFAEKKPLAVVECYKPASPEAQLPESWVKYYYNRSLNFSDFCRDSHATKYENGKTADKADLQSRWRTIEWWRKNRNEFWEEAQAEPKNKKK